MGLIIGPGRTVLQGRDEWGARPPKSTLPPADPDEGCVDHHVGGGIWNAATIGEHVRCAAFIRGIQAYHMDARGWQDIAYNFVVCPHGVAFVGRGFGRNGANGTAYWNARTITVLWLIGAGDPFGTTIRDSMARAVRDVMDWAEFAAGAAKKRRGHSDIRATSCPRPEILEISHSNYAPVPTPPPSSATIVGSAAVPGGYYLADTAGRVYEFGAAVHRGDLAGAQLAAPIVGIAVPPGTDPRGYWLVGADGGVFAFGVPFFGSLGGITTNARTVGLTPTPTGKGYRLVGADGGIFTFGDAAFYGSIP